MSQQKVDKYKEFKKNRKEELEKERKAKKRTALIWKIVGLVCAAGLVVALAVTGWNAIDNLRQARPIYTRDSLIIGDIAGISETEEETTTAAESTEAPADSTEAAPESAEAPADSTEEVQQQSPESDETGTAEETESTAN